MRKEPVMPAIALAVTAMLVLSGCTRIEPAAASPAAATSTTPRAASAPIAAEPESRTPVVEACALLSRAEVESIFGTLKSNPKSETGLRREKECRYQNTDGQWLRASLYGADRWELERGIVSEMHPAPISGLGDEAFSVKQGTDSVVYVRKGGGILEVSCSCGLQKAQAIATRAVTKI